MILINVAFVRNQEQLGNKMPPQCGVHSNGSKFFVDRDHEHFPNLLIAVMRGEEIKNREAREAMRLLSIQITEQDRNRIAASLVGMDIPYASRNGVLDNFSDVIRGRLLRDTAQIRRKVDTKKVAKKDIQSLQTH